MKAYQLKIQIKNSHPPIWRRCIVPAGLSFSQLSIVLNTVMGWCGYHLSSFAFYHRGIMLEEEPEEPWYGEYDVYDASEYLIDFLLDSEEWFTYTYDFGDDWEHRVTIEKVLSDYDCNYPKVLKYKGETPYEDCGGIEGYYELLEILKDPARPEHEEMKAWTESHFHQGYDLEDVNRELSSLHLGKKKSDPMSQNEIQDEALQGLPFKRIQGKNQLEEEEEWDPLEEYDFLKELKQMQREFAENMNQAISANLGSRTGKVQLQDIFACYQKKDLVEIAKIHSLGGYYKYNKKELIDFLCRELLSEPVLCRYFLFLSEEELRAVKHAALSGQPEYIEENMDYLHIGGYCSCLAAGRSLIPEDVLEAFRKYCGSGWEKERKEKIWLLYYLNAAAELYGVFPVELLLKMYEKTASGHLSEMDLFIQTLGMPEIKKRFVIENDQIILKEYNDSEMLKSLTAKQRSKPYYSMTKSEIASLGGEGYLPFGRQLHRLCRYLIEELDEEERDAENICKEIQYAVRIGADFEEILQILEDNRVVILEDDLEELAGMLLDVGCHTRLMANRGYTTAEMDRLRGKGTDTRGKKSGTSGKIIDFNSLKRK